MSDYIMTLITFSHLKYLKYLILLNCIVACDKPSTQRRPRLVSINSYKFLPTCGNDLCVHVYVYCSLTLLLHVS